MKDDDKVINVFVESKNTTLLFITKNGMVLNADKSDVPVQGRISGGVKGINLSDGDSVIFAGEVTDEGEALVMTNRGFIKRVLVSQIDVMARYRKGVKIATLSDKENGSELIYADYVKDNFVVVGKTDSGELHSRDTDVCPIESRTGKGKLIEKMKKPPVYVAGYRYLV
jgi:topoisomerase-4 subunit A